MNYLKFKLIKKCFQDASRFDDPDVDFLIEEDGWNDYAYHVMYHLHATTRLTKNVTRYLGPIRIMKEGQQPEEIYLLRGKLQHDIFENLPENFVSLTMSLDLFGSLNHLLSPEQRESFIHQMHLILDTDSQYYEKVKDDECFTSALLRDSSMDSYALIQGKEFLGVTTTNYDLRQQEIKVKFINTDEEIPLKFSFIQDDDDSIPNGIIAFIGKNGSGKSSAIYNLAKMIYASPDQRYRLNDNIGYILPNDIGFNKLILISYSPFDNFVLPGIGGDDYRLILNGIENHSSRLIFCGIRDIKKELTKLLEEPAPDTYDTLFKTLRLKSTDPKPVKSLAEECSAAMYDIKSKADILDLWNKIKEQSIGIYADIYNVMQKFENADTKERMNEIFLHFSTGYKFFLHSLTHVIAYIENNCMILFDEPENHIHPPMLSFMMTALRFVLRQKKSVMLVTTHSPVILQETFSTNVFIVRNIDESDRISISHPQIETYGANIAEITREVFDLTSDVTRYYNAIDFLYDKLSQENTWNNVNEMLFSFKSYCNNVSPQIISYLINKFSNSDK